MSYDFLNKNGLQRFWNGVKAKIAEKAKITLSGVDPGEGASLGGGEYYAVYGEPEQIGTTRIANGAVTTAKIADDAVTSDKIDFQTLSAIQIKGSTGDTVVAANTVVNLNSTHIQRGTGLTRSGNTVVVGAGVAQVRVSASVFMNYYSSVNYGWVQLQKNSTNVDGARAVANLSNSGYDSVQLVSHLLDVAEGDIIKLVNIDPVRIRLNNSWMTVEQVA